jgi:GTPase
MDKEDDFGNIEYKLKLVNPDLDRVEHLTTQMKFRLEVTKY